MRICVALLLLVCTAIPSSGTAGDLQADLDALFSVYVTENGVRYHAWFNSKEDLERLSRIIDGLEALDPAAMSEADALAYWINLYNAVTLELVLSHYPLSSIKDAGGLFRSPWKKKLVTVSGEDFSLDKIENGIIREQFEDARIHFALNCASVSCPPLAREIYRGQTLDEQLEAACRRALNDPQWVKIEEGRLVLSKIFDWYREDFEKDAGSVIAFIAKYRNDGDALRGGDREIEHADYDWSLNQTVE